MNISIAMATYNGAKYLEEQLNSFLNQTRRPDELVVCDDGSDDTTLAILEAFQLEAPFPVRTYRNESNLGHIRNFEKVLSLCDGELIFLSDQDDIWDATKISVVLDSYNKNPGTDVVVNDAYYTDEKLKPSGVTVLQKVVRVGGGKMGHIAGACTAITKRFCDFITPFPKDHCPQHDVYIHRWANLIGSKLVLDIPLQVWRIHGLNTTTNNEMSQAEILSPLNRYMRTRHLDTTNAYLGKANEFRMMKQLLEERSKHLLLLPAARPTDTVRLKINQIIDAHMSRSRLINSGWLKRKQLILQMIIRGQYQHFKGLKSIAKDILR